MYLMQGHVYHSRSETASNSFKYPIFNVYFSVSHVQELHQLLKRKFMSWLSLNDQDYLKKSSSKNLSEKCKLFLEERFNYKAETIFLQTIPRMFGYAFNPVNFWYCYRAEKLEAVLCEVNNTFGETHYYWLFDEGKDLKNQWLKAEKQFHVSPFFAVDGEYKFRFCPEKQFLHVDIKYLNLDGSLKLNTWVRGELTLLENISFAHLVCKYGWLTPLVVFRIHYQALKLFIKKVQFFRKPSPPIKEITNGSSYTGH